MKKLTRLFLCCTMLQHFVIHSIEYRIPSTFFSQLPQQKKNYMEEGFGAHTCVATSSGNRCINELMLSDYVIDKSYNKTEILGTHKGITDRYIKLFVEDEILCVGCKQRFHVHPDCVWVHAQDLKVGDQLIRYSDQPCTVHGVEIVYEQIFLHAFRVEQHSFLVTSYDLLAHNMDVVAVSASGAALQYISFTNPVVAIIGATVALSVIAHRAYEKYTKQPKDGENKPSVKSQVRLAEKGYYEQRRTKLQNLKNEFVKIKQDLENFCGLYGGEFVCFIQQILKHYMQYKAVYYTISVSQEINLPEQLHANIRKVREAELRAIEKDIIDLQFTLGLHINELIAELEKVVDDYDKTTSAANALVGAWNMECSQNKITKDTALKSYERDLFEEHLVTIIEQRVRELKLVIDFYSNHCHNISLIKKCTNIMSILQDQKEIVAQYEKLSIEYKQRLSQNIAAVERYFASRGIAYVQLKNNIRNALKAEQQNNNEQKVKSLVNKRSGSQTPNGPKKDDDDKEDKDDNDFWEKLKARSDKSARTTQFGKMYRDKITKLWWSKDLGTHGGSYYKVFKEGAKGFEWVFDAAKKGVKIFSKHKGPTGRFISYKDVIFKS